MPIAPNRRPRGMPNPGALNVVVEAQVDPEAEVPVEAPVDPQTEVDANLEILKAGNGETGEVP